MQDSKNIKQFVANVADKNYSQANNFLQKMIENKLKERIKVSLSPKK